MRLLLLLVLWFCSTPSSLLAAPVLLKNSECVNTWCSQGLSRFEGEIVDRISFLTWVNLDHAELLKSTELTSGFPFSLSVVKRSIENLYLRDIFQHIEPRMKKTPNGLHLQFVLTPTLRIADIEFSGNFSLSDSDLRRSVRVRPGVLLDIDVLNASRERLLQKYQEKGFYSAEVSLRLEESLAEPQVLATFYIVEGPQSSLSVIEVSADLPADIADLPQTIRGYAEGLPASDDVVERIRWETLLAIRKEGYIQASVEVLEKRYQSLTGEVELTLRISPRSPITFYFNGNSAISDEEMLKPLRLMTRRVPFSPSAIQSLRRDIVELYQRRGYYFATVEEGSSKDEEGRTSYRIDINEGDVWKFSSIRFSGNERVEDDVLREKIESSPSGLLLTRLWRPRYLVNSIVEKDRVVLENFYASIGQAGTFVSTKILTEEHGELALEFVIEESEARTVSSAEIEWEGAISESGAISSEVVQLLNIYPRYETGEDFVDQKVELERLRIETRVRESGFPKGRVSVRYDEEEGLLRFIVVPGEAIRIGRIWLQGNNYTHDRVILRELSVDEGDPWQSDAVARSQRALYGLGFFRRVEVGPLDGVLDDPEEDLRVRVLERDTGSVSAGLAFTTEDGVHLSGELAQRNLFGGGSGLIFGVDSFFKSGSEVFDAGRVRAAYVRPRFLELPVDFSFEGFFQTNITLVDQFSSDRAGITADWRFGILEDLRGSAGLTAFHERLFDVEDDIVISSSDRGSSFYSILQASLEFDKRDDVYNPREGSLTEVELRLAGEALGSEESFFAASLSQAFYIPFGSRWVWSNRFAGDYLRPFAETDVIPLGQRVFLGGRRSLRGFSKNAIGPRGVLGNVAGGDSSLNLQTEFRYDLTDSLAGVVFLDAGQAFLIEEGSFDGDRKNLEEFRFSPGFGVHYKTPIGPLSAELGFATDREEGERFGRFNLGIGTAF